MAASHPEIEPNAVAQPEKGLRQPHATHAAVAPEETIIVDWDGECDPNNPLNWSLPRKWFTTILTSLGGLVTLMSGPMLAPALGVIGHDLEISAAEASMALSIFILAFAFGPLVLAPLSEVFGRRPIWIVGCTWYIIWNTVCGVSTNKGLMIAGRFLAGLGASAEFAVSGPIANDCWSPEDRGKSFTVRAVVPLLGPALGPIIGGVMVQELSWRWLFFVLSIFDAFILLLFIIFLPETHRQTLLSRKATSMRKSTGDSYYTRDDLSSPTLSSRLKLGLVRPFRLLITQPVVQLVSLLLGYQFGLLYIVHSTFANMWIEVYGQSPAASGLHYLAIVTGCILGAIVAGWGMDRIWMTLKEKNGGRTKPENRVPLIVPGAILFPIGLLWYGWSAQRRLHWVMSDIGVAIFGFAYLASVQAAQAYIVDAFLDYTASATAASQFLRNIFAFAFPIFAPALYSTLGYGVGNTLLAAVAVLFGIPGPYLLWRFGERLREKGGIIR
ncbi:major facilitator superfamily transporter [Polyplosphaeria fusca]|uniref:Major facilitator superfamily transporter n=1 Tax=Polyplosphaeria fusca TaxID=682080 RepID=A0A9P4R7X9_9PLEO|nr:major facilitator superfamily transporter [Polyplosphaeria fusca]